MFGLEKLLGIPLGWLMYLVYSIFKNYGIALVVFTLLTKLLLFPISYNQQKNTAKMQALQPKIRKLQKGFANNPTRLQEEQMKLYAEEGYNPMSGCLPMLVQFALLFGVLDVVYRPLSHILRISKSTISSAQNILTEYFKLNNITDKYFASRPELTILEYAKSKPEVFSSLNGFAESVVDFDNTFFGINLGQIPTFKPEVWNGAAIGLFLIPIISGVLQLLITIYTQRKSKQNNPDMPSMGAMNIMLYGMPIFSVWFAFQVPAGVGFYWTLSSFFSLLQTVFLYNYFTPERSEKILVRDREKAKKKGRKSMFERMVEQQDQLNNGSSTNYQSRESGVSRATQQASDRKKLNDARKLADDKYKDEFDRSLSKEDMEKILNARRRMAEKYGDDYK